MELKLSKFSGIFAFIFFYAYSTNAQYLGVGACINHTSNGINIFYSKTSKNEKWTFNAGVTYVINTQSLNANYENHVFYQNGYAKHFLEHFNVNGRLGHRLFKWKMVELDAMANLNLACQGILQKANYKDSNQKIIRTELWYFKASPSIEFTMGLQLRIKVSERISIFGASGIGYIYLNHKYEGWSITQNRPVIYSTPANKPYKIRGDHDFVGLDGMPMMTVGVKYKLWRNDNVAKSNL